MNSILSVDGKPLDKILLTRKQLAPWLTERGYKISYSTLSKICSPAINSGPPTECYWGRQPMHRPSRALDWARGSNAPGHNSSSGLKRLRRPWGATRRRAASVSFGHRVAPTKMNDPWCLCVRRLPNNSIS